MQKWALLWAFAFLLLGCSDNNTSDNFNYLRSASEFKADTVRTDTLCNQAQRFFTSQEQCLETKKFILRWESPEDTVNFQGFRIYLDTVPPSVPADTKWKTVRDKDNLASFVIPWKGKQRDGLVIFLTGNRGHTGPDTIPPDNATIFPLDTTGREEIAKGEFVFGLVTRHGGGKTQGEPRTSLIVTRDNNPPEPFNPVYTPGFRTLSMKWARPGDKISYFNPTLDSGAIMGYWVRINLGGNPTNDQKKAFKPLLSRYLAGGDRNLLASVIDTAFEIGKLIGRDFFLPDSGRSNRMNPPGLLDTLRAEFSNLRPQDTLELTIFAVDSAGNTNKQSAQKVTVRLTDTTEPSLPKLSVAPGSVTRNGFVIAWPASRDSVDKDKDGILELASHPNANILEYRLSRTLKRDSTEKPSGLDRTDTLISVNADNFALSEFRDTVRFLPPGTTYIIRLFAIDSSGHHSKTDSLEVTTLPVRFTGKDSLLSCPAGFIPIPGASFHLGDTSQASQEDEGNRNERPIKKVFMRSFCIEPYEHRDAQGRFVNNATWYAADSICKTLSPGDSSRLCSEAEWERACEGDSIPLLHGIQSEKNKPELLQTLCNQATNDTAMASDFDLRNKSCLTKEGVYDLGGNFSEWVRDPYRAASYASVKANDTLDHLSFFSARSDTLGFRGGNYLIPDMPLVQAQNLARCSNRDFPQQVRPKYRTDCRDTTRPKIVVIYGTGLANHHCVDLPDSLRDARIVDMLPARDTMKVRDSLRILVFKDSSNQPISLSFKEDTAFALKKPLEAKFTPLALAVVVFENAAQAIAIEDTLDALEMKDTSQATLEKIFQREAGSAAWSVRKENGRYKIRFIYAYTQLGTKPARPYFSNRAIAFRCCSFPKPPPPRR